MIVANGNFDAPTSTAIPVIASFSANGEIKPLYFKYEGNSVQVLSYRIKQSTRIDMIYECMYDNFGTQKKVILRYHFSDHAWFLEHRTNL